MPTARTFSADRFALTLDGVTCGFVESADGGDISADVVEEAIDATVFAKKHIGQPKYEDFILQIGLSLGQPVYDWIAATLQGNHVRKDGSVTTADFDGNARAQSQFFRALVREVGFPALDAAGKDAAHLTVKFSPGLTTFAKASGKVAFAAGKQKPLVASHFRLELDGVDCSHVRAIDAFAARVDIHSDALGDARALETEPGRVDVDNVHVSVTDGPTAASWQTWFNDFVISGKNDDSQEKNGAIVYLGPDQKTELGRVVLHNVGICALRHGRQSAKSDQLRTLDAELYCERIELQVGTPAPAPQPLKPVEQPVTPIATPVRPIGIRR